MSSEVGSTIEGKVTGITKFGLSLNTSGDTGLVHISEVANTIEGYQQFPKTIQ